jgi:glycosyltransferase involved in cell wall biosynthesis
LELIPAVLKQNHPKFELILVDDRSSDETYDYAIELQRSEKLFKLLRIDERQIISKTKNMALQSASKQQNIIMSY